jgi:hypothetical protein
MLCDSFYRSCLSFCTLLLQVGAPSRCSHTHTHAHTLTMHGLPRAGGRF